MLPPTGKAIGITVLPWIVAGAIINFERNFARKYFVNFWEYKYFWESNCSSRSVIEMMRAISIWSVIPGSEVYTTLGGGDYSRGLLFEGGYYSREYGTHIHIKNNLIVGNQIYMKIVS